MLPVLAIVGFFFIDALWAVQAAGAIQYIVTETARCEAISSPACSAPNNPQSYASAQATNLRLQTGTDLELSTPACTDVCSVTIRYTVHPFGVYFPPVVIQRTGTAAVPPQGGAS